MYKKEENKQCRILYKEGCPLAKHASRLEEIMRTEF
jgi:hypothetical protein